MSFYLYLTCIFLSFHAPIYESILCVVNESVYLCILLFVQGRIGSVLNYGNDNANVAIRLGGYPRPGHDEWADLTGGVMTT